MIFLFDMVLMVLLGKDKSDFLFWINVNGWVCGLIIGLIMFLLFVLLSV